MIVAVVLFLYLVGALFMGGYLIRDDPHRVPNWFVMRMLLWPLTLVAMGWGYLRRRTFDEEIE